MKNRLVLENVQDLMASIHCILILRVQKEFTKDRIHELKWQNREIIQSKITILRHAFALPISSEIRSWHQISLDENVFCQC